MGEPLKNSFGPDVPQRIAAMIEAVHPRFRSAEFVAYVLDGTIAIPSGKVYAERARSRSVPAHGFTRTGKCVRDDIAVASTLRRCSQQEPTPRCG